MGRGLFERSAPARAVFEEADEALGFALSRLCFEGPEAELKATANTQPAILTHSVAATRTPVSFAPTPTGSTRFLREGRTK